MPSSEARAQIIRFCARRERSQREVLDKIRELQAPTEWLEELKQEGWWNQERFAKAYAFDHWNLHHWGKRKISHSLRFHDVPPKLIEQALSLIPEEEYLLKLKRMMQKKTGAEKDDLNQYKIRQHFIGKGYLMDEIERVERDRIE
ncbi:MAG: RecX family transcriptional regulator [Bacteroidetes bacterium]|nr:RecX family transcriptional regulator [Bacteroidota bacterium]